MTNEQFIYWLKGFIDYQQLQEQRNPAFTRIKDELQTIEQFSKNEIEVSLLNTGETGNSNVTYKTDSVTYTTKEKAKVTSYI
jgi:hypothetical protein